MKILPHRKSLLSLVALASFAGLAATASAANQTWTGGTSTDWANSLNWNSAAGPVPANGDVAEFITSYTNNPTLTANTNNVGLWSTGGLPVNTTISLGGNTLNLAGTTTINGNANTAILLDNTGGRSLNINGTGTIAVLDNTSFLVNNNTDQLGINSTLNIAAGKTLTLGGSGINASGSILFSSAIAATTGAVYINMGSATGNVNFGNVSHQYTGGTTVHSGILTLGTANPNGVIRGALTIDAAGTVNAVANTWSLGQTATTSVSSITINGGTLNFTGSANGGTVASSITMTGGTISGVGYDWYNAITSTPTFTTNASSSTATVSSGMQLRLGGHNVTFNVAQGTTPSGVDLLVSGAIKFYSGAGANGVTKTGAGTMVLSGSNTYTGTTVVNQGTLLFNGDSSAATGAVTVNAGALGGTGKIGGATTLASGAKLGVADGAGNTLTFSNTNNATTGLDISAAVSGANTGALAFDLGAVGSSDEVVLTLGGLKIGSGVLNFNDFAFTAISGFGVGTYTLFHTGQSINGSLDSTPGSLTGTIAGMSATLSFANANQDIVLSVVPEPSTYAMVAGGFAMLIGLQGWRRRRN